MKAFLSKHVMAYLERYGVGIVGVIVGIFIGSQIEEWYWQLYIVVLIPTILLFVYAVDAINNSRRNK